MVKIKNTETTMGYEKRVVAFIDILGFKEAIKKSNEDENEFNRIRGTLTELKEFFNQPTDHYEIECIERRCCVRTFY